MLPEISGLIHHCAVFLPADPARSGRIALWRADGTAPRADAGRCEELTVITPDLSRATVVALVLSVDEALPLLTRARSTAAGARAGAAAGAGAEAEAEAGAAAGAATGTSADAGAAGSSATAFWGAAALLALRFAARGQLLPGLSPTGHDTWRIGPLDASDLAEVRELAAAMPPTAHCVPLTADGPPRLPAPEPLLRAFLDAVADTLPRSPAAPAAAGGPAYAARPPRLHPELRGWAAEVAAGHDAGVRISVRIELDRDPEAGPGAGPDADSEAGAEPGADHEAAPLFRAVLQLHSPADAALVADAAEVWAGSSAAAAAFPPGARMDALRALRRAARLWPPLAPLLGAAVPDFVELADEEVTELLGEAAAALAADGVQVHWPRGLLRDLSARAVLGSPDDTAASTRPSGLLSPGSLLSFSWRHALGDQGDLTRAELDRLAEAKRPLVRLRDRWVLIDPAEARRARARQDRRIAAADALAAVLTGSAEVDGKRVDVEATGPLEGLRARLAADPQEEADALGAPPELRATLRDYQLRGLRWLARMTSLGLGACLADDMGLGKTVTLIALHLHRNRPEDPGTAPDAGTSPDTAGPTLVVCPASLLGNWQREIEKFAPGTPVRRFHGPGRSLAGTTGGFVLTTYGTMRLDAPELAATRWGLVVADEAQHVKNPRSSTARALRTIPATARVALTGTPVENDLSELWAVLDWTTPGILGRLGTFRSRFADPVESGRDPQAAARLSALVRPFLLRRKKSDPGIAPELPPKTETDHTVALSREQTSLYEAVVRETLAAISEADGMERRGLVVKLLTSLKQICNHPAHYLREHAPADRGAKESASGTGAAADIGSARSGKLELLDELLDTIVAEGGSALVFTQYVAMARILEKHLAGRGIASQLLHGGTPVPRREELVDRFQAGEVPVFLEQATDRAYRIGQTQPVQVHRIIAEGTVEDRIAQLLARKRALADSVLAGGESALTELTDAELAELVALRPTHAGSER
ncbi:DEAD/DEAH box helicase [Streptomyces sp. WM6368]|uniref:DEAD/DEAH box helicase n=1 Tax=Streptomyces sp. WM6368 TaxID=1415554 RepID=UPI0006B03641|nr:DEAD/DEAH box helicase [Streptomyces sp. WM6368]